MLFCLIKILRFFLRRQLIDTQFSGILFETFFKILNYLSTKLFIYNIFENLICPDFSRHTLKDVEFSCNNIFLKRLF